MTEYKVGNAIVRMHGTPDLEKVKAAAEQFLMAIEKQKQQNMVQAMHKKEGLQN